MYEYDYLGNRTKYVNNGEIINYYYNEMNQLIKEDGSFIKEYLYDSKGRLIKEVSETRIKEYQYGSNNKLSKVSSNDNEVNYYYDGLNKLVKRKDSKEVNEYVLNHLAAYNDILIEDNKTYTYDGLGIHSIDDKQTLLDHLASITSIIDNNKSTKISYDEFGNITSKNLNDSSFTGYLYDEVSELNYAQARFYNARLGRFVTEDNIVNSNILFNGFNRYEYVKTNPKKYVDRDGNIPITLIGAAVGGGLELGSQLIKNGRNFSKFEKFPTLRKLILNDHEPKQYISKASFKSLQKSLSANIINDF